MDGGGSDAADQLNIPSLMTIVTVNVMGPPFVHRMSLSLLCFSCSGRCTAAAAAVAAVVLLLPEFIATVKKVLKIPWLHSFSKHGMYLA